MSTITADRRAAERSAAVRLRGSTDDVELRRAPTRRRAARATTVASILFLLLVPGVSPSAQGGPTGQRGEVVFSAQSPSQPPPWQGRHLFLPQFHPAAGQTLVAARIAVIGRVTGSVQMENSGSAPRPDVMWMLATGFSVQPPIDVPPLRLEAGDRGTADLGPNGSGRNSFRTTVDESARTSLVVTDPRVLASVFTGSGTCTFVHAAGDLSHIQPGSTLAAVLVNNSSVTITVTYVYTTP